jgi:sulfur-oxidizing protein SoxY
MRRRGLLLALATAPARATPAALEEAMRRFCGDVTPSDGGVQLEVAPLVENGNAVPVRLFVDAAQGPVRRLALLAEGNPQPEVIECEFFVAGGRYELSTRIRLASSQTLVALAEMADGRCRQTRVAVVVTLAACVDGG